MVHAGLVAKNFPEKTAMAETTEMSALQRAIQIIADNNARFEKLNAVLARVIMDAGAKFGVGDNDDSPTKEATPRSCSLMSELNEYDQQVNSLDAKILQLVRLL